MNGRDEPLLDRLMALRDRSEKLGQDLQQRQETLAAELSKYFTGTRVSATVTLDERGFPTALDVSGPATQRTASEYTAAVTNAFLIAQAKVVLPLAASRALIEAITEGRTPESATVEDDLRQFTVTASFGSIRAVTTSDRWIKSLSDEMIAAEILRVAQQAATASDTYDRFI